MRVRAGTRAADAGSMVALLRLGAVEGERLRISAQGPNAASRLRDFQQVISGLSDGEKRFTENAAQTARMQDSPWRPPGNTQEARCVGGLPVGPGLVAGTVYKLTRSAGKVPDHPGALAEDGRLL